MDGGGTTGVDRAPVRCCRKGCAYGETGGSGDGGGGGGGIGGGLGAKRTELKSPSRPLMKSCSNACNAEYCKP